MYLYLNINNIIIDIVDDVKPVMKNTNGIIIPCYIDKAQGYGVVTSQVQMPLFFTAQNRIKTYNGTAVAYWVSDNCSTAVGVNYIDSDGGIYQTGGAYLGVVPSFMLIADS